MGSFYTVVGLHLPNHEPFIKNRSHCDICKHQLSFIDMIPIISYILLKGKCRYCHTKFSNLSTYMELFTGILFACSYYVFGFSYDLLIAIGIISLLIIVSVSDISYFIIPDELLIFFSIYFLIIIVLKSGLLSVLYSILSGFLLFSIMYIIMLFGNFIFKKETLGGGDIKMMFVLGLILHPITGIFSIFISSCIALPISMIILWKKNQNLIPFGPFLILGCALLYYTKITPEIILKLLQL